MKIPFLVTGLLLSLCLSAQQPSPAEQLAQKIAQKIKDSLKLSPAQQTQLYEINMQLHNRKMETRKQYGTPAAAAPYIQIVENGRDSLYRQVIPAGKFNLYLQKKSRLVSNN
ncbi:hypothetical protein [Sediminibacterium soli]|uniref:hypothetical protein n=1 Tax=Sediminibacterium soli TaxID=2698829 RepID=UPI001379F391|nr:hypothetical protein [Sediminibacterium soli]NCI45660.1 hypothetical protein [Sediminibacterium soli]